MRESHLICKLDVHGHANLVAIKERHRKVMGTIMCLLPIAIRKDQETIKQVWL